MAVSKHKPSTQKQISDMAGASHLQRRTGGTYYLRVRVPDNVRAILGKKEIVKSLGTTNPKEAKPLAKAEYLAAAQQIADAQAKLAGKEATRSPLPPDLLAWLTKKFFISLDQERLKIEADARDWNPVERADAADGLKVDAMAINGVAPYHCESYGQDTSFLDSFLETEAAQFSIQKGSEDYQRLLAMFRSALTEHLSRTYHGLEGRVPPPGNFQGVDAFTSIASVPDSAVTLGVFKAEFLEYQKAANENTTSSAYRVPLRALSEVIGDDTRLSRITRNQLEEVMCLLEEVPLNMVQKYPGLSIRQAIQVAKKSASYTRLSARTIWNYYILIVAFFNYAKLEQHYISENPAASKKLRGKYRVETEEHKDTLFTDAELKKLFAAPLYTGCVDDLRGYNKPGDNIIRRGRFWVPLIALFHGLRSNEACQLYVEDIKELSSIPCMAVRVMLDSGKASEKRVKNKSSWRNVPIHPELIKMGFLDYVAGRRADGCQRLFPELPTSKTNDRLSHVFSKWFSDFKKKACGFVPKGNFHGFRKHVASGLTDAGVPDAVINKLAGWKSEGMLHKVYNNREIPELYAAIRKLTYSQLDFSPLFTESGIKAALLIDANLKTVAEAQAPHRPVE